MGKHFCKECGKHLGYHYGKDLPFRCMGDHVEGLWKCKFPFNG
jgi:hypothetical protein